MSGGNTGGYLLIGLMIFGLGAGCNEVWGDSEVRTEYKVDVVKVPSKPDTRVIRETETVVKTTPLPGECNDALNLFGRMREIDDRVQDVTGTLLMDVKEAHTLLATGRARELVPVTEALMADVNEAGDAAIEREKLLIQFDDLMTECRKALDD